MPSLFGYMRLAAAVLRELAARERGDGEGNLGLALAATATELMRHPATAPNADLHSCDGYRLTLGEVSLIAPPGTIGGERLRWTRPARRSGPHWQ